MGKGQKLYEKGKKLIPGGTMLLSKRPEMFLPNKWPSYFSKAKGCEVWDLDKKRYFDMTIMGIGTNSLGYGNYEIDNAVRETISKGNMSTLNCPEEVELAERLIEINPWAGMVRFARSGGEANSIAIRIARAASGKDGVAVCGYHGWHDWYLSANHNKTDNLSNHLLPGLEPLGVPKSLSNTVFPFQYNDYDGLVELVNNNNIGVIKMEVMRNFKPKNDFLSKVRDLANKKNIVLIFDECTSGFRETNGGLHKKYKIYPDLCIFGKALGNGYAINAIMGKDEIMNNISETFISSTNWTESIGVHAGIGSLIEMNRIKSWKIITKNGKYLRTQLKRIFKKNKLDFKISGLPSLTNFEIISRDWYKYKAYITQEMLKQNILANNVIYLSIHHDKKIIDRYLKILNSIFNIIYKFEVKKLNVNDYLENNLPFLPFKRLN